MTAVPSGFPSGNATRPVRAMRCARHGEREAVARCVACSGFFCRECIAEHNGRLLCSNCLARALALVSKKQEPGRGAWGHSLVSGLALLTLWGIFYLAGLILSKIPPDFHEGTLWKKIEAPDK